MRPCYDHFYDLDRLWEIANVGELPNSPRMQNMAKMQNLEVISDVHSGLHDTLQLTIIFDFLRKKLSGVKKPYAIAAAKTSYKPRSRA